MNKQQKYDFYYKLWEFHANLLWNRVQYLIVIMAGIYAAWFLLLQSIMEKSEYDYIYLILSIFLCVFGFVICYNFLKLAKRDIQHQQFYEKKLSELFRKIKGDSINMKARGRYIFPHLLKLCMISCTILCLFSMICFIIKKIG